MSCVKCWYEASKTCGGGAGSYPSANHHADIFFDENGSALYVGRGRNVRQRILQHSRPAIKDEPFAWLLARDANKRFSDYTPKNSRAELLKDPIFRSAMKKAKTRITQMTVSYVVEEDDTTQCLLENYTVVELSASHNSFRNT